MLSVGDDYCCLDVKLKIVLADRTESHSELFIVKGQFSDTKGAT